MLLAPASSSLSLGGTIITPSSSGSQEKTKANKIATRGNKKTFLLIFLFLVGQIYDFKLFLLNKINIILIYEDR